MMPQRFKLKIDKLKAIAADTLKPWKIGGVISLNGQQVSLTNWAAGGNNSISVGGLVNVFAKYKKGTFGPSVQFKQVLGVGFSYKF